MSETKHTKEPWMTHGQFVITGNAAGPIDARTTEDAERIVTCVNACGGVGNEALPVLLASLKQLVALQYEDGRLYPSLEDRIAGWASAQTKAEGRED